MSTQKLPSVVPLTREMPRINAIAIAIPAADDTNMCHARPAICER